MTPKQLGFTLAVLGFIGGLVAYGSILHYGDASYWKMGVLANTIQLIGIFFIGH